MRMLLPILATAMAASASDAENNLISVGVYPSAPHGSGESENDWTVET